MMMDERHPSYSELKQRLAQAEAALRAAGITPSDGNPEEGAALSREAHINRVLLSIRNVNQLILRERHPVRLIERACANLTETLGYYNAWIALFSDNGESVDHLASSGLDPQFEALSGQLAQGRYPDCMKRALETDGLVVVQNPIEDCSDCTLAGGYAGRSGLACRLDYNGVLYGLLIVSVPAEYADDDEEKALFVEVAGDLAFALYKITLEQRRESAETALCERVKELTCIYEVTRFMQQELSVEALCNKALACIPPAMHHPDIAAPEICIDGARYCSSRYSETLSHYLHADISAQGRVAGYIRVYYTEDRPFLILEEQRLLQLLAGSFGEWLERIRSRQALAREKRELEATLYGIGDGVIATDAEGCVARMNRVAEQLTGWAETDALGRPLEEVFHIVNEFTRERVDNPAAKVIQSGCIVGLANHTLLVSREGWETAIADSSAPILDGRDSISGVVLVFRDQSAERLNREIIAVRMALIDYATKHSLDDLLRKALDEIGRLVESPIGFYHFVEPDQNTLSLQQWSTRTMNEFCRAEGKGMHYNIDQAGVWVDCVKAKKPVIHNDYASLRNKKGLPDGHAPVIRELVTPVMRDGRVVAILGVDNKETDYTEKDLEIVSYLADVTWELVAHKRVEEEVSKQKDFLNTLLEAIPIPVFYKDREGRYIGFNRAFEAFYKKTREQLVGKTVFELAPPDLSALYHAQDTELFNKGGARQYVSQVRNSAGECRDIVFNKAVFLDEAGNCAGIIGTILDITDLKQAEAAVVRERERFKQILDCFPLGIKISDRNHNIEYVNPFLCREFGDPGNKTCYEYFHELSEPCEWCPNERVFKGETFHWDAYMPVNGKQYELFDIPLYNEDGSISKMEVFNDITARKEVELERERLRLAIEQAKEMFVITDLDGCILYVNPAFEKTTGHTRREVAGNTMRILKSGKQDASFYREMWAAISSGNVWSGRMVNKRKDGSLFTEESTISPVHDASGNVVNYVSVKRDISEHLRLTVQFQQAQKMEAVGRLAGGVAHDFNNMLSVILGQSEIALEQTGEADPLYGALLEIQNAAQRSADLTRQLLAFARKQTISPKVLDLNQSIGGMLKMLKRLIGEDIELAWLPGSDVWSVLMDPSQLDQVLANLCLNARDAIKGVGKVTIETENLCLDEGYSAVHPGFSSGEFVRMAVSDNGCGMDAKTINMLFEPFFTTKALGKGTGLGLATVYGIIKQNKGFINVYSEPGSGTTFHVYFARHQGEDKQADASMAKAPVARGDETILLVEDEESILNMAKMMLERQGYTVLMAQTPGDALRTAEAYSGKIHLLMTDVIMPEMNGRQLAERLTSVYPQMKLLFMSGYTADVIANHGILDEGVHFIQKPFSLRMLAAKLRDLLDDHS